MSEASTLIAYDSKIGREELARVPTPPATATHQPIPHHQIVEALGNPSPPDLVLIPSCAECEFQTRRRQKAERRMISVYCRG